jgi:hypothetical protein
MTATRITAGTYREVWQDAVPLNGGTSLIVPTGIRANAVSLSRVFGVLALQTVAGAPSIAAVPSVVNGLLVVTLTNTAAPGNSATWQLNVLLTHSMQQGLDPFGAGCIYVLGLAGNGGDGRLNVRLFGATGDGVTDDGPALLAALAAANDGDTVFFPKGAYRTTQTLATTKRVNWIGEGYGSQVFMDGNKSLITITEQRELRIRDLALFSNNTDATKSVLHLARVHASDIDVSVFGGYNGLRMQGCVINLVRLHASVNNAGIFPGWAVSPTRKALWLDLSLLPYQIATNANTFLNPCIEGVDTGVHIDGQNAIPANGGVGETDNQFIGGSIESCVLGLFCDGAWQPTTINGTHFEASGRDLYIYRSANITVENAYLGSFPPNACVFIDQSQNVNLKNCYVRVLELTSTCNGFRSTDCVVRVVVDNSPDAQFFNKRFVDVGSLPYGPTDYCAYGSRSDPNQTLINTNVSLDQWSSAAHPNGYTAHGGAVLTQDSTIYRTGGSSTKIVAPYAPLAYAGLSFALPPSLIGKWITVEVWTYATVVGNALIGVGHTGDWDIGANASQVINGWIKHTLSFLCRVGADRIVVFASAGTPTTTPLYVDSIRIYAQANQDADVDMVFAPLGRGAIQLDSSRVYNRAYFQTSDDGIDTSHVDTNITSQSSDMGLYDVSAVAALWDGLPTLLGCFSGTLSIAGVQADGETQLTLATIVNNAGASTLTISAVWYDTLLASEVGSKAPGAVTTILRFKIGAYTALAAIGTRQVMRMSKRNG